MAESDRHKQDGKDYGIVGALFDGVWDVARHLLGLVLFGLAVYFGFLQIIVLAGIFAASALLLVHLPLENHRELIKGKVLTPLALKPASRSAGALATTSPTELSSSIDSPQSPRRSVQRSALSDARGIWLTCLSLVLIAVSCYHTFVLFQPIGTPGYPDIRPYIAPNTPSLPAAGSPLSAAFPLDQPQMVTFEAPFLEAGSAIDPELDDQLRDWLLFTVLSQSSNSITPATPLLPPRRDAVFSTVSDLEYGPLRSARMPDNHLLVLTPKAEPAQIRAWQAHAADRYRLQSGQIPDEVEVFEYTLEREGSASLTRRAPMPAHELYTSTFNYETRTISKATELDEFLEKVGSLTWARLEGGALTAGGRLRTSESSSDLQREDLAALWQAGMSLDERARKFLAESRDRQVKLEEHWQQRFTVPNEQKLWSEVTALHWGILADRRKAGLDVPSGFALLEDYDYARLSTLYRSRVAPSFPALIPTSLRNQIIAGLGQENPLPLFEVRSILTRLTGSRTETSVRRIDDALSGTRFLRAQFDEALTGTRVGMLLYYTDLLTKIWASDYHGLSPSSSLPGFVSLAQRTAPPHFLDEVASPPAIQLTWSRDERQYRKVSDGTLRQIFLDQRLAKLQGTVPDWYDFSPASPSAPAVAPGVTAFADWWTGHYNEVASLEPAFDTLSEVIKWGVVFDWLRESGQNGTPTFLQDTQVKHDVRFQDWLASRPTSVLKSVQDVPFRVGRSDGDSHGTLDSLSFTRQGDGASTPVALSGAIQLGAGRRPSFHARPDERLLPDDSEGTTLHLPVSPRPNINDVIQVARPGSSSYRSSPSYSRPSSPSYSNPSSSSYSNPSSSSYSNPSSDDSEASVGAPPVTPVSPIPSGPPAETISAKIHRAATSSLGSISSLSPAPSSDLESSTESMQPAIAGLPSFSVKTAGTQSHRVLIPLDSSRPLRAGSSQWNGTSVQHEWIHSNAGLELTTWIGDVPQGRLLIQRRSRDYHIEWRDLEGEAAVALARRLSVAKDEAAVLRRDPSVRLAIRLEGSGGWLVSLEGKGQLVELRRSKAQQEPAKWQARAGAAQSDASWYDLVWSSPRAASPRLANSAWYTLRQEEAAGAVLLEPSSRKPGTTSAAVDVQFGSQKLKAYLAGDGALSLSGKDTATLLGRNPTLLTGLIRKIDIASHPEKGRAPPSIPQIDLVPLDTVSAAKLPTDQPTGDSDPDARPPPSIFQQIEQRQYSEAADQLVDDPVKQQAAMEEHLQRSLAEIDEMLSASQYGEAVTLLDRLIQVNGDHAELLWRKASARLGQDRARSAASAINEAHAPRPDQQARIYDEINHRIARNATPERERKGLRHLLKLLSWRARSTGETAPAGDLRVVASGGDLKTEYVTERASTGPTVSAEEAEKDGAPLYIQDSPGLNNLDWGASLWNSVKEAISSRKGRLTRLPMGDAAAFEPDRIYDQSTETTFKQQPAATSDDSNLASIEGATIGARSRLRMKIYIPDECIGREDTEECKRKRSEHPRTHVYVLSVPPQPSVTGSQ